MAQHNQTTSSAIQKLLKRFAVAKRGNVAMMFALSLLPLMMATGAGLDYARALLARSQMFQALDAAGLAIGGTPNLSQDQTREMAQRFFEANFKSDPSYGTPAPVNVVQSGQDFTVSTSMAMPTAMLHVVGINTVPINVSITVTRNSNNVEVALALDVTGSMAGQKISDLKIAAKDLIDLVVQDTQTPTYSKLAIVPYSMGVNVGSYAQQVRGSIAGPKAISGATRADPVVITASAHGFSNGDYVYITGVSGMTQINNKAFRVANRTMNSFALSGIDGRNYSQYGSGGNAYCTIAGCEYFRFRNPDNDWNVFRVSTCVSERTTNAYSDTSPSTTLLGRNYPSPSNDCLDPAIVPLSTSRSSLKSQIDGLAAGGSTAGHIGVGWAWYMLSPNFGYLWPGASQPAAYGTDHLLKVAVIMTDGEYNSMYCNGVISEDSTSGSGSTSDHIDCDAPNGHAFDQAQSQCTAMKAAGVIVYTVGFAVVNDQRARDLVNRCATNSAHVYLPANGGELKDAFRAIAQSITSLRVAK